MSVTLADTTEKNKTKKQKEKDSRILTVSEYIICKLTLLLSEVMLV